MFFLGGEGINRFSRLVIGWNTVDCVAMKTFHGWFPEKDHVWPTSCFVFSLCSLIASLVTFVMHVVFFAVMYTLTCGIGLAASATHVLFFTVLSLPFSAWAWYMCGVWLDVVVAVIAYWGMLRCTCVKYLSLRKAALQQFPDFIACKVLHEKWAYSFRCLSVHITCTCLS